MTTDNALERWPSILGVLFLTTGALPVEAQHPCTPQAGPSQDFEHLHGGPIECVFFKDALEGWTGEEGGRMRHTTDGGSTWHFHYMDDRVVIHDVYFLPAPNDDYGWAVGGQGTIWRTTDGGDCWTTVHGPSTMDPITDFTGDPIEMFMINFEPGPDGNSHFGMCVGRAGTLLLSGDSGQTWTQASLMPFADLYAVTRTSQAWHVAGDRYIFRSVDDGDTWTGIDLDSFDLVCDGLSKKYPEVWDMAFVSDLTGFAAGGSGNQCGYFLRTDDGGDTWIEDCYDVDTPYQEWGHVTTIYAMSAFAPQWPECSSFPPRSQAATVGYGGQVFLNQVLPPYQIGCSTGAAHEWYQYTPPPSLPRVPMKDVGGFRSDIWYSGQFGILRNTDDCGANFYDVGTPYARRLEGGAFVSDTHGTVVGQGPGIFDTTDGGLTWTEATGAPGGTTGRAVAFSPLGNVGIAVGDSWMAVNTSGTWDESSTQGILHDVAFASETVAYAVGYSAQAGGALLKASHPQWAFTPVAMLGSNPIYGVAVDGGTVYAVGANGTAYEITNNGSTVDTIGITGTADPMDVDLRAVATNGMETWAVGVETDPAAPLNPQGVVFELTGVPGNYAFDNETTAIAEPLPYSAVGFNGTSVVVGGLGGELQTFDGSTWSELDSNVNTKIVDLSYPSTDHGFLIGRQFNISETD